MDLACKGRGEAAPSDLVEKKFPVLLNALPGIVFTEPQIQSRTGTQALAALPGAESMNKPGERAEVGDFKPRDPAPPH